MASRELFRLLNIIDQRDIGLGKEDVLTLFDTPEKRHSTEQWMRQHLGNETLLTREELSLNNEDFDRTLPQSSGQLVTEADLKAAILSLETGTAAIEQQTRRLEGQKQALRQLQQSVSRDSPSQVDRTQRIIREKAQLDLEVSELSQDLQDRIQASTKQVGTSLQTWSSNVDRLLGKDDRLLDGLDQLISKITEDGTSTLSNTLSLSNIDRLCDVLVDTSRLEVQNRVDDVYRTALASDAEDRDRHQITEDDVSMEISTLRAELAELTHEIPSLVTLVVDSRYRNPLHRELSASYSRATGERSEWSTYLLSTIKYLTSRLDVVGSRCAGLVAHRNALQLISYHCQLELDALHLQAKQDSTARRPFPQSPAKDSKRGLRPLMLLSRAQEGQDPAISLLRQFDIKDVDTDSEATLLRSLGMAMAERREQQQVSADSAEDSITRALSDMMAKGGRDADDLTEAVLAYSTSATFHPMDDTVQRRLESLEDSTQRLGASIRTLDMEAVMGRARGYRNQLR